jgi:hypothetical protein
MAVELPIVLLCALPASGKSETRKLLKNMTPEQTKALGLCEGSSQVDDYPYVSFMRDVDDVLEAMGQPRFFFRAADQGFFTELDWGTLVKFVNEDYADMAARIPKPEVACAVDWLFERYDRHRAAVGCPTFLKNLPAEAMAQLRLKLEKGARQILDTKWDDIPETLEGKTVVIEFARGGRHGSSFPLPAPMGYEYTFSMLSEQILSKASILYIKVTPEQSRAKNVARAQEGQVGGGDTDKNTPQLSLNHGVPHEVMMNAYGCDDLEFLKSRTLAATGKDSTIRIQHEDKTFDLPVGIFDNTEDLTTWIRSPKETWTEENIKRTSAMLVGAFEQIQAASAAL